jgi:hypothetical protein
MQVHEQTVTIQDQILMSDDIQKPIEPTIYFCQTHYTWFFQETVNTPFISFQIIQYSDVG